MISGKILAAFAAFTASLTGTAKVAKAANHGTPFLDRGWYPSLVKSAGKYKIPVTVALSQVKQESGGNERALGSAGEIGLLQLKQSVLTDYVRITHDTARNLYSPVDNIEIGLWYLSWLRDHYKITLSEALLAYNSGIGNFLKGHIQNPRYSLDIIERASTYAV